MSWMFHRLVLHYVRGVNTECAGVNVLDSERSSVA